MEQQKYGSLLKQNAEVLENFHEYILQEYIDRTEDLSVLNHPRTVPHIHNIVRGAYENVYEEITRILIMREGYEWGSEVDFEKTKLLYAEFFDQFLSSEQYRNQPIMQEIYWNVAKYFQLYQIFHEDFDGYRHQPVVEVW